MGTLWDERFASLGQRDSEATLDPTLFRMYTSGQGRWLSPDPIGGDISNPQSLNRYAYVLNNPCSLIDPLGLEEGCGQSPFAPGVPLQEIADGAHLRPGKGGYGWFGAPRTDEHGNLIPGGHKGNDLRTLPGTPVFPIVQGTVESVDPKRGWGINVFVNAGGDVTVRFSHLEAAFAVPGEKLERDTLLGFSGTSGNAGLLPRGEEHLDIEVRKGNVPLNLETFASGPCPKGVKNFNLTPAGASGGSSLRDAWLRFYYLQMLSVIAGSGWYPPPPPETGRIVNH